MTNYECLLEQVNEIVSGIISDYVRTEIDVKELDAVPDVEFLKAAMCFDPKNANYGTMRLWFAYLPQKRVFSLMFHVHTPKSCGPGISNQLKDIREYVIRENYGLRLPYLDDTDFGTDAFLKFMDEKSLKDDPEALALKRCEKSLQAYSRKNKLCQKLRKMDRYCED